MGASNHQDPEAVTDSHHEMLTRVLQRYLYSSNSCLSSHSCSSFLSFHILVWHPKPSHISFTIVHIQMLLTFDLKSLKKWWLLKHKEENKYFALIYLLKFWFRSDTFTAYADNFLSYVYRFFSSRLCWNSIWSQINPSIKKKKKKNLLIF